MRIISSWFCLLGLRSTRQHFSNVFGGILNSKITNKKCKTEKDVAQNMLQIAHLPAGWNLKQALFDLWGPEPHATQTTSPSERARK